MSENTVTRRRLGLRDFNKMIAAAVVIMVLTALLYVFNPFPAFWNNLFANLVTIFVASLSAFFATRVFLRYDVADAPRGIWFHFALGLWLWVLAEVIWSVNNMLYGEVGITFADPLWVLAYGFFAYAVYIQYQLVFRPTSRQNVIWVAVWSVGVVLLTFLFAWLLHRLIGNDWGFPLLLAAFYPVCDLFVGLAALRVIHRFHGGALGYPWIGLLGFAVADMLYSVLDLSGLYTWSVSAENNWSTIADLVYNASYLFIALGCFAQYLLLRYGPIFRNIRKEK